MSTPMQEEQETKFLESVYQENIDGDTFKELISAGLTWLRTNQEMVNALNVFPVPDGDTGTNMVLTMQAAYDEIANSPDYGIGRIAGDLAQGALMGARGNSGVILSQILRGFARVLDNLETLDGSHFAKALNAARDTAYHGVVRPVEGTILTVIKDCANAASQGLEETNNPFQLLEIVVVEAEESVERTPELLDVLADAGVVDSGGKGLFFIFEGMLRFSKGLPLDEPLTSVQTLASLKIDESIHAVEPGQDFEVVVDFTPNDKLVLDDFYADLEEMGTSIQIGEGDGMYRMHIHVPTENRYKPIDYTMELGTITKVHIENLMAQMDEIQKGKNQDLQLAAVEPDQIAVVAVAPGDGIARVFASLGAAAIVEGGQTMNPSTKEILAAFEDLPTDKIIILPNNKNIFMAAEAATEVTVKNVAVIPARTVPQGIAAMLRLIPNGDFDDVVSDMKEAITEVETGEITTATRNAEIDGVKVNQGDIIALHNGKLVLSNDDLQHACLELLDRIEIEEYELITLFYGSNIDKTEVNRITDAIRKKYPDHIIEVQEGGQPHYQFIISIE